MRIKVIIAIAVSVMIFAAANFAVYYVINSQSFSADVPAVSEDIDMDIYRTELSRLQQEREEEKKESLRELLPSNPDGLSISENISDVLKIEPPKKIENPDLNIPQIPNVPDFDRNGLIDNSREEPPKKVFVTFEDFLNY